ncbi:MAG: S-layer homology domain-containing protein, partial [Clostridia bacterium]|nr:S-layer homology domain-containing protein [Clostridia bacterium]
PVNPFGDVSEDDYFYKAVLWAVGEEITTGTSATEFSPDAFCTRAQIVTFLFRASVK